MKVSSQTIPSYYLQFNSHFFFSYSFIFFFFFFCFLVFFNKHCSLELQLRDWASLFIYFFLISGETFLGEKKKKKKREKRKKFTFHVMLINYFEVWGLRKFSFLFYFIFLLFIFLLFLLLELMVSWLLTHSSLTTSIFCH